MLPSLRLQQDDIQESSIKGEDWKIELEQVAPQLALRIHVDHKDWRTHVEEMEEHKKVIEQHLGETMTQLSNIADEVGKVCERITKREKMLASDQSIAIMVQ